MPSPRALMNRKINAITRTASRREIRNERWGQRAGRRPDVHSQPRQNHDEHELRRIAGTEDDLEQGRRPRSDRRGGGRNRGGGGAGILTGHPQNRLHERCPFALSGFFVH